MYDHLGTWTNYPTTWGAMRLDLWDTGRTRDGKSELRYTLYLRESGNAAVIDGEDFYPSPLHAIDSDETAAALLCFMAADGESLAYSGDDADCFDRYRPIQRYLLRTFREHLAIWESELEPCESPE